MNFLHTQASLIAFILSDENGEDDGDEKPAQKVTRRMWMRVIIICYYSR